jgi:hypothetical protein
LRLAVRTDAAAEKADMEIFDLPSLVNLEKIGG